MNQEEKALQAAVKLMTFSQLDTFLRGLEVTATMPLYTAVAQRLYEIALYDNYVPKEHRKAAIEWLDTVHWLVETNFKQQPDVLQAYRRANAEMEEGANRIGIGSLAWLLSENNISNTDEMLSFVSHPKFAHLLDAFYETLGPDLGSQIRQAVEDRKANTK